MLAVASHVSSVTSDARLTEDQGISGLASLAQATRLSIYKLLIKHEPVGIAAGIIAETIGAPHNTLSTHLGILVRAGLLRATREGRTIIYRSNVKGMQSLIQFLVNDCCDGHPGLCNLRVGAAQGSCYPPSPVKVAAWRKSQTVRPGSRRRKR